MSQVDGSNGNESGLSPINNSESAGLILHQSNSLLQITSKIISSNTEKIHDALNLKGIPTPSNYEIVPKDDYLKRGELFMSMELHKKAIREFTLGIEKAKGDLKLLYYNRGYCRSTEHINCEGAISDLLKAIQLGIDNIDQIKYAEEHIGLLKSWAINLREKEKRLLNFIYHDRKWEEAQPEFNKLSKIDKAQYYYQLGTCRQSLGDYENAIKDFEIIKSLGYDIGFNHIEQCKDETFGAEALYSSRYYMVGWGIDEISLLIELQEYEVALKLLDQHFPEKGHDRECAFLLRGTIKEIMGDVEAALDDYKQGKYNLGFNQGKHDLYIGMKLGQHYSGVILYNQKRYLEADALLSDALLRKEGYWSVKAQKIFFDRAMTRHRLKMYEEAIEDYTSAIAIEPANPFFYLGRYYSKLLNKGSGENDDETDLAKYKELMKS